MATVTGVLTETEGAVVTNDGSVSKSKRAEATLTLDLPRDSACTTHDVAVTTDDAAGLTRMSSPECGGIDITWTASVLPTPDGTGTAAPFVRRKDLDVRAGVSVSTSRSATASGVIGGVRIDPQTTEAKIRRDCCSGHVTLVK